MAGTTQAGQLEQAWLAEAFAGSPGAAVTSLSASEMAQTRGKLALLPFIGLVVGTDIALASFFWGVYVPTVGGSGCGTICTSLVQQH
jgi:hypothetical protein